MVFIACGRDHSAAVTRQGSLYTWGSGPFGRLGHGYEKTEPTPRLVGSLLGTRVASVSCGYGCYSARTAGQREQSREVDRVSCCGMCCRGGRGGLLDDRADFTLVLTEEGVVYSFGAGNAGQLGVGT